MARNFTRGTFVRRRELLGLVCVLAWSPWLGQADSPAISLMIGPDWTVVREQREITVTAGEQVIELAGIPAEADLSSLTMRTRRIPVTLLSWQRIEPYAPPPNTERLRLMAGGAVHDADGRPLSVRHVSVPSDAPVRARIRIPFTGTRTFEVSYRLHGLSWRADYQALIRGSLTGPDEQLSIDLDGYVNVLNQTSRSFGTASVRVAGADPRLVTTLPRRPGFLLLLDTPLSDLWQLQVQPIVSEFAYALPAPVALPAGQETRVQIFQGHRIPARRLHVLHSDEVPLSLTGRTAPLSLRLVFSNVPMHGLGWTMPPGPVTIFSGVTQRRLEATGFIPHTPSGREIRLDLGNDPLVRGARTSVRRTTVREGQYDETFRIALENAHERPVDIEIIERPLTTLGWSLQRSTFDFVRERRVLRATPRLGPGESRRIELGLRLQKPDPAPPIRD